MDEPPIAKGPRRRWAFSLLNLLLGSALLMSVISHVVASRELFQVKAEVKKLRAELGFLDIRDPKKCYVTQVPQLEPGSYLFRVYLPQGHSYGRKSECCSEQGNGASQSGSFASISESGEFTLRARLYRDESGVHKFTLSGLGSTSTMQFGPGSAIGSPSNSSASTSPPSLQTTEIEPGKPIELLTLKVEKADDPKTWDEIKVWLEDPSAPLVAAPASSSGR